MSQIGDRLGISRHRVGRLLREAIETGVVKIEIQSPFNKGMEIEQALENAFGLKASLVVEVNPDLPPEDIKLTTCKAGAEFLRDLIKVHHTIGVGWGTTTFELINQLGDGHRVDIGIAGQHLGFSRPGAVAMRGLAAHVTRDDPRNAAARVPQA